MLLKMYWAWSRGATVMQTPDRDGYAAVRGSGVEEWVATMLSKGWHRWTPMQKEAP